MSLSFTCETGHNKIMNNQRVKQVIALLCEGFRYDCYENNEAENNFVFSACFEWSVVRKALGQHTTWRGWKKKHNLPIKRGHAEKTVFIFKRLSRYRHSKGPSYFLQKQAWFWHYMVSGWTWFCSIHIETQHHFPSKKHSDLYHRFLVKKRIQIPTTSPFLT